MNKVFLIVPTTLLVSGCFGGSGANVANVPTIAKDGTSATLLREFSDDAGVLRATIRESGEATVMHAMVPEARTATSAINEGLPSGDFDITLLDSRKIRENEHGSFYEGQMRVNGRLVSVVGYEDNSYPVGAVYMGTAGENMLLTGGEEPSNIPSGTYVYRGTNVIGYRDGSRAEDGTFEMTVDFSQGQASINAETPGTVSQDGSGNVWVSSPGTFMTGENIPVNTQTGTFSSDAVQIGENGGVSTDGSLYGSFHGDGAVGVTGVYHDNAATPLVAGAIIGDRR